MTAFVVVVWSWLLCHHRSLNISSKQRKHPHMKKSPQITRHSSLRDAQKEKKNKDRSLYNNYISDNESSSEDKTITK